MTVFAKQFVHAALFAVSCQVFGASGELSQGGSQLLESPLPVVASRSVQAANGKFALTMDKIPVQQLVMVFYDQCEKRGLVFDPTLNKQEETLTIKTPAMTCAEIKRILTDALYRAGVVIEQRNGFDVVVQAAQREEVEGWQELIYRPRFRDPLELAQMTRIAIRKGSFAHERRGAQVQLSASSQVATPDNGNNGASITGKPVDKLVFFGPPVEAKAIEKLLSRLDVATPQVEIAAGIYEFQSGQSESSAVQAALKLFNGKLGLTVGGGAVAGGSTLKLSLPSIEAALSLLDSDSRFKYVAQPKVLAKDAEQVVFTSGQDVRVNGSVTVNGAGQAVQSKTTLTAGVTLQATPYIRGEVVDLTVHQQVSDFVASPNDDPSVMRRELTSRLVMQPGYVYVIGGLKTNRTSKVGQTLFGLPIGRSVDTRDTEVLLLLSVKSDSDPI
jgi:type II secretory pathway component GspD/PulD (secretin)